MSTKTLNEEHILSMMRLEWSDAVKRLSEEVVEPNLSFTIDGEDKIILSPELKVLHKDSGIRYTVDSVGPRDIILRTPENVKFLIDKEELESNYELD